MYSQLSIVLRMANEVCAFSFACVGAAMANETWKFVQAKSKQAMKQVLGIGGRPGVRGGWTCY